MRVVICWPYISGYMAACWRAISAREDLELSIIGFKSDVPGVDWQFEEDVVCGLNIRLLAPQEIYDFELIRKLVVSHDPQIVVLPGWSHKPYCKLVDVPELSRTKFVMTMDTPYRGTLRQRLGRFKISHYLSRISRAVVPGERAWQFARALHIPEQRIRRGLYGFDYTMFAPALERRRSLHDGWPRKFIYVGRYHPDKAIDVLLAGYRAYRASVQDPWDLTCCGTGGLEAQVNAEVGVTNTGFVQPDRQPEILADHGVFVLASRFEPWGVAIAEACAAGLPVIHSEACGAAVELVRPYFNGIGFATEDAAALAGTLRWCHQNHLKLPDMGARGQPLAEAYSADAWAERWMQMFRELCDGG